MRASSDVRFVAIGDSFTEGVGDELDDGTVRGWADLVAEGWASARGAAISYANLAIRGKLIRAIVDEQLERALALRPTHLSFNGGGNDMLRPRADLTMLLGAFRTVVQRCAEEGVQLIVLSGANPSGQLPMGRLVQRRGDRLSELVTGFLDDHDDVIRALNWPDRTLAEPEYWSPDRLHMNARGHHRVAARVLDALGSRAPDSWWSLPESAAAQTPRGAAYYRQHVGPWVQRRLTGRSSGDGREPKFGGEWSVVRPLPA